MKPSFRLNFQQWVLMLVLPLSVVFFSTSCNEQTGKMSNAFVPTSHKLTNSGYPYVHHIKNEGATPQIGDEIEYHQIVFRNDSLLYSSLYSGRPRKAVLPGADQIPSPPPPDYEGLLLMSVGDSLSVYQTLDTFPAAKLPPGVSNSDVFIYNMKLVGLRSAAEVEAAKSARKDKRETLFTDVKSMIEDYNAGKLKSKLQKTESGLQYVVLKEGEGPKPLDGSFPEVEYAGFLTNGESFDDSWQRDTGFRFRVGRGQVIQGWDEGVPLMSEGAEYLFFIPYQLAYGEAGKPPSIPERSELVFHVTLVDSGAMNK